VMEQYHDIQQLWMIVCVLMVKTFSYQQSSGHYVFSKTKNNYKIMVKTGNHEVTEK
jgi:hypothetical protein